MATLSELFERVSSVVWGALMLALLPGTGLYLTLGLHAMPVRRLGYSSRELLRERRHVAEDTGQIAPFQAL